MRLAPLSLSSIAQSSHPSMRRIDGRFTPYTLPIPEQRNNNLTSIPTGSFSDLTGLQTLELVRDAPRPALAPILRSVVHPAMRRVDGRFTLYTLPIREQHNNQLTSISAGSFSNLTSLQTLELVRDALRPSLAPIHRSARRFPPRHAPCRRPLYFLHPPHS